MEKTPEKSVIVPEKAGKGAKKARRTRRKTEKIKVDMHPTITIALIRYMGYPHNGLEIIDRARHKEERLAFWKELLKYLQGLGYEGDKWETVKNKWSQLQTKFKAKAAVVKESGAQAVAWPYFSDMMEAVGTRPKFKLVNGIDSGAIGVDDSRSALKRSIEKISQPEDIEGIVDVPFANANTEGKSNSSGDLQNPSRTRLPMWERVPEMMAAEFTELVKQQNSIMERILENQASIVEIMKQRQDKDDIFRANLLEVLKSGITKNS